MTDFYPLDRDRDGEKITMDTPVAKAWLPMEVKS